MPTIVVIFEWAEKWVFDGLAISWIAFSSLCCRCIWILITTKRWNHTASPSYCLILWQYTDRSCILCCLRCECWVKRLCPFLCIVLLWFSREKMTRSRTDSWKLAKYIYFYYFIKTISALRGVVFIVHNGK